VIALDHVESEAVPKPPGKPKKGKMYRLHLFLPGEMVELIDRFAEEGAGETFATTKTRTDAIRVLVTDGLKKRGLLK
jgi:hypothetical protein